MTKQPSPFSLTIADFIDEPRHCRRKAYEQQYLRAVSAIEAERATAINGALQNAVRQATTAADLATLNEELLKTADDAAGVVEMFMSHAQQRDFGLFDAIDTLLKRSLPPIARHYFDQMSDAGNTYIDAVTALYPEGEVTSE